MKREGLKGSFTGGTGLKNTKKVKKKKEQQEDYRIIGAESRIKKPVLCEYCKKKKGSTWHHIWSSFRGKRDNSPTNLIRLCFDCHFNIHNKRANTFDFRQKLSKIVLTLIK